MRQKRSRRIAPPAREPSPPFDVDIGATARQVATIETGTGAQHGPGALVVAFGAVIVLTAARVLWRALARDRADKG